MRDKSSHKTSEAKTGLREAKSCLLSTIGEEAKQLGVHLDSFILLGKLHFAEGCYKESLEYYERANIDNLEEKQLPPRSLKIMAEAFASKFKVQRVIEEHSLTCRCYFQSRRCAWRNCL